MDSSDNKAQAERCVQIAQKAMEDKDWAKVRTNHFFCFQIILFVQAERFLHKSMKFEENQKTQNLLYKLDTMRRRDSEQQRQEAESPGSTKPKPPPEPEKPAAPEYTAAQVRACKEILAKKNYYDILGVQRNAAEDDIKKAYKKHAIKLHPDKNRAPQAGEAFKKVSAAYACLTDSQKRRIYDQTGEEPGNMQSPSGRGFRHSQFEQEIDPDEIFRMFFGGGLFEQPRRRQAAQRPGQRNRARQEQDDPMAVLRQFLPLLFVVFMSLLTGLTSDASSYSHHEA